MTVRLDWPSDLVDRLTEEAQRKGLSLNTYVLQALSEKRDQSAVSTSDDVAKRREREEAGRSIRELRKGNVLGPEMTVRNLIEEGRRF